MHWVYFPSYALWLFLKTCATLWVKHMQRDKTWFDQWCFLSLWELSLFFLLIEVTSVDFNISPCPDWLLWWIICSGLINTQIKTPRNDYHVTSPNSTCKLYSKRYWEHSNSSGTIYNLDWTLNSHNQFTRKWPLRTEFPVFWEFLGNKS